MEFRRSAGSCGVDLDKILDIYGPQLGEIIWHSVHLDDSLREISEQHAHSIVRNIETYGLTPKERPLRILEVGAYAHFDVALACSLLGSEALGWAHDISPKSLRLGAQEARKRGLRPATAVAGDFHRLPFSDEFFDMVFCASCVHHTYQPWLMMSEMLRVVRRGGILRIENEPVARKFCFYQFRSNRPESRTKFEQALEDAGLTWTISSPFPGSRPEALFGMVENDRIPLSIYLNTFERNGTIEAIDLIPQIAAFEKEILALPRDSNLETKIFDLLSERCERLKSTIGPTEKLLRFDLPDTDRIWQQSYESAERIRGLDLSPGDENSVGLSDLFGATLRASVRKVGATNSLSAAPFLREMLLEESVYIDLPELADVRLDFRSAQLPEIEDGNADIVKQTYSSPDWIYYEEVNGIRSVLNFGATGRIALPELSTSALMLVRFYSVARSDGAPYLVRFLDQDGRELSRHVICQTESHLARFLLASDVAEIGVRLENLDGSLADDLHVHIRIGVARLIPINKNAEPH